MSMLGSIGEVWLLVTCDPELAVKVVEESGGLRLGIVPAHPPDPSTIVISRW